ncbi:GPI-linked NAD(P)(+)--arginine ADP-ribosyltransferase 1-like [Siniperca chuatsi]|uniref:GPI-linked NAD(P)(+)--arginine ADP-ribosyltransferase 1-like n=1 Tax=Siniperca chuatsi TaxID=119488 RepID=UPI001CE1335A|nr:GPI-linked NAD(P)(+)--arginine ADP-ribosyltransferase 1-like [Siniperca chuatsi]
MPSLPPLSIFLLPPPSISSLNEEYTIKHRSSNTGALSHPSVSHKIRFNFTLRDAYQEIPLSMAEDSVDDMYFGCNQAMFKIVKNKYLEEEKNMRPFKDAWKEEEKCAEENLKKRAAKALTKDHMQAICVYTSDRVYKEFNDAVRTKGSFYSSTFQFHSLHFLLTSAVQILNRDFYCHNTYRRTNVKFTGKVNQLIRFGSFASSSYRTDLIDFGNETCFKTKTCSGAFLKNYSKYKEEEEVLIPPYETFKITDIINGQRKIQGLEDCKVVYVLESAGAKSTQNCKVALE